MLLATCLVPLATQAKWPADSGLDLEPSLRAAALVVAVRVEDVNEVHVVRGGKGSQSLYQYTFAPIRVLKGVYSRPQLLMTSMDLQGFSFFDPQDLRQGQERLLILGRSRIGYTSIQRTTSADLAFPMLDGDDDPLLHAVDVLVGQEGEHDRRDIVGQLSEALGDAQDRGAGVLLAALARRSYVAAQHAPAFREVGLELQSDSVIAREAAAHAMHSLLEADYLGSEPVRARAVADLVAALEHTPPALDARVAAFEALAAVIDGVRANQEAVALAGLDDAYETFAELAARLVVFGALHEGQGGRPGATVSNLLAELPLDAPPGVQRSASRAWGLIAGPDGAGEVLDRMRRKQALALDSTAEIEALGLIFPRLADPWPVQSAVLEMDLTIREQHELVRACEHAPSPRLVPALGAMLDPRQAYLRRIAADLLMEIDTRAAAETIRVHLAEETDLAYKLSLAAFLGRHGFDDGFAYALEHMSEPRYLEASVEALGDIRKPGSVEQLLDIYAASNDLDWQRAAVRTLGVLGHEPFRDELRTLSADQAHPLAASALIALADLEDADLIDDLPAALASRRDEIAVAAARAAGKLLPDQSTGDVPAASVLRTDLAVAARDPGSDVDLRRAALEALVAAEDPQVNEVLVALIRDARLEQTDLLARTRELMRERRVRM